MQEEFFEGLATDFSRIETSSGVRIQYHPTAFDTWLVRGNTRFTSLLIGHDVGLCLPFGKSTQYWTSNSDGLFVHFSLDVSDRFGRGASLAIRHGWLSSLSLGAHVENGSWSTDDDGDYRFIWAATVNEVSLTGDPACAATWVASKGRDPVFVKTMPSNPVDRYELERFLSEAGIEFKPTPTAKAIAKPAAILASIRQPARSKASGVRYIPVRDHQVLDAICKQPKITRNQSPKNMPRPSIAAAAAMTDDDFWTDFHTTWMQTYRPEAYAKLCRDAQRSD